MQLVRPTPSGEDTRRRATFDDLGEPVRDLVTRLATKRLVVTGRDAVVQEETVEVAHEALIRHWGRFAGWLNEDREFLLWRERLRGTREAWLGTNRDTEALLRGTLLVEAERWLAQRGDLTEQERDYVGQG